MTLRYNRMGLRERGIFFVISCLLFLASFVPFEYLNVDTGNLQQPGDDTSDENGHNNATLPASDESSRIESGAPRKAETNHTSDEETLSLFKNSSSRKWLKPDNLTPRTEQPSLAQLTEQPLKGVSVSRASRAASSFLAAHNLHSDDIDVINWSGARVFNNFKGFVSNLFCTTLAAKSQNITEAEVDLTKTLPVRPSKPTLLNVFFGCKKLFARAGIGTGNYLNFLYGVRLTARTLGNIHVLITCQDDPEDSKLELILPWITGWFPDTTNQTRDSLPYVSTATQNGIPISPTTQQACGSFHSLPVQYMVDAIKYELQRMAVSLVGPIPGHPSLNFKQQIADREAGYDGLEDILQLRTPNIDKPLVPNVELDDAVLHLRCGDVMTMGHKKYGFLKFNAFSKVISPSVRSIGIITQPFHGQQRVFDTKRDGGKENVRRCKVIVYSLMDFLKEKFPAARISLRNDSNETIALAYARFIMAKQSIAGISSFSFFPAMATFGTGYIRKPDSPQSPNGWILTPRADKVIDNLVLMDEPKILTSENLRDLWAKDKGEDAILKWFWRADADIEDAFL